MLPVAWQVGLLSFLLSHSNRLSSPSWRAFVFLFSSTSYSWSSRIGILKLESREKGLTLFCIGVAIFPGLLSPLVQRVLLDRLLHRDLSNPEYQTNLHLHYDIDYPPDDRSFFTTSPSDILFTPKDSNVHSQLNMTQVLQKKLRWITLGGQYDWTKKVYPTTRPHDFPQDIADLIKGLFHGMMEPQAAIANVYSPGDTLSLHRDVSEEVDMPLVSISLGCDCLFLIAVEDNTAENGITHSVIRLRSGDALIMMGESRFAWHGVPKIVPDTCPDHLESWPDYPGRVGPATQWNGWMRNKRINLNVRQMV